MIAIFPEIAAAAADMQIETVSFLVRKYFGQGQAFTPKLNVIKLSQAVGIPVSTVELSEYGALVVKDDKGRFSAQILISSSVPVGPERNFLVAHLLGHFFLHAQPHIVRGEWKNTGFKESFSPMLRFQQGNYDVLDEYSRVQEAEADAFASAILLPKAMLKRAMIKLKTVDVMSKFFNVGGILLDRRLETAGLVGGAQPGGFLGAEASLQEQQKMHHSEVIPKRESQDMIPKEKAIKNFQSPPQENRQASADTSTAKVKRSMAMSGYKQETAKAAPKPSGPQATDDASQKNPIEKSLKMFRDLASRLDSTVPKEE